MGNDGRETSHFFVGWKILTTELFSLVAVKFFRDLEGPNELDGVTEACVSEFTSHVNRVLTITTYAQDPAVGAVLESLWVNISQLPKSFCCKKGQDLTVLNLIC